MTARRRARTVVVLALAVTIAMGGCSPSPTQEPAPEESAEGPDLDTTRKYQQLGEEGCAYLTDLAAEKLPDVTSDEFVYADTSDGWTCLPGGSDTGDGPLSLEVSSGIPGGSTEAATQMQVDRLGGDVVLSVGDGPWSVSLEIPDGPSVSFTKYDDAAPHTFTCRVPPSWIDAGNTPADIRDHCGQALAWMNE